MATSYKPTEQNGKRTVPATTWENYERLKRELKANAATVAEYDAAIRRAAELAGA